MWKLPSTEQEEALNEGLSDHQQNLVSHAMSEMGWNREIAISVLEESNWVMETAISRWHDSDVRPEGGSNSNTSPRRTPFPQSLKKRTRVGRAEPGSPKKQKTDSPESQRPRFLDEIPEAAQARRARVLGLEQSAVQGLTS